MMPGIDDFQVEHRHASAWDPQEVTVRAVDYERMLAIYAHVASLAITARKIIEQVGAKIDRTEFNCVATYHLRVEHRHASAWDPQELTVGAYGYERLLAIYTHVASFAINAEKTLELLKADIDHPEFFMPVVDCPHQIDAQNIELFFAPNQEGHNALNQLSRFLTRLASKATS